MRSTFLVKVTCDGPCKQTVTVPATDVDGVLRSLGWYIFADSEICHQCREDNSDIKVLKRGNVRKRRGP
jgi:hypothetical protein